MATAGLRVVLALWFFALICSASYAQAFFGNLGIDPATGVDKGSVSTIQTFTKPTGLATASTIGSHAIGPYIGSVGYSVPNLFWHGDQLDVLGVLGGLSDAGGLELAAGGLGYRIAMGDGLSLRSNADFGRFKLGTKAFLPLRFMGTIANAALGLRKVWQLGQTSRLTGSLEVSGQDSRDRMLGSRIVDENLRFIRLAVVHEYGRPFQFQRRLALSLTKGEGGFGASPASNPQSSLLGATSRFLRVAFSAEASFPLPRDFLVNAGIVGQWSPDSLPLTQRCGYGTNAYSRGFDQGYVNGDKCLGSRVELAYDFHRPNPSDGDLSIAEGFVGIDRGYIEDNANAVFPLSRDHWSSLSLGARTLRGNFLGEIALTRILDLPAGPVPQAKTRLWIQTAVRF